MTDWTREKILAEADRIRFEESERDKREAIEAGREVLTPAGVAHVFSRSATRIRAAGRSGEIEARFTMTHAGRTFRLYTLASCVKCWGEPDAGKLRSLRADPASWFVTTLPPATPATSQWLVLSPYSFAPLADPGDHVDD